MFKKLETLDALIHKDLRWDVNAGFLFARNTNVCFLGAFEVAEAAKEYPVVFSQSGPCVPQAVFSTGKGPHPFIAEDGRWTGRYIPAFLRTYPFMLGADEDASMSSQFTLMVDVEAPHFQNAAGLPLFSEDQSPAPALTYHIKLLEKLYKSLKLLNNILLPLREQGFFSREPLLVRDSRQQSIQLTGFTRLLPKVIRELDAETLKQWNASGILSIFYAHLHSISNFGSIIRSGGFIVRADGHADPNETQDAT